MLRLLLILSFTLSIILLLYRLDTPLLWEDEGEVVLIARNINRYGLPLAWDGEHFITQEIGEDSAFIAGKYIWSWNTWLPYYATALSFKIFGEHTWAARLPFALAGILILFLSDGFWRLINPKNDLTRLFASVSLSSNVLFYLFVRQARYYAFTMLFSIASVYFFLLYLKKKKRRWLWAYVFSLILNFHANFVLGFSFTLPIIIYPFLALPVAWFKSKKNIQQLTALVAASTLFILQSILWLIFIHPAQKHGAFGFIRYWGGFTRVAEKAYHYLNIINSFYFPWALVGIFLLVYLFQKNGYIRLNKILAVLLTCVVSHIGIISIFLQFGQKYLLTLIPVLALFMAYFFARLHRHHKLFTYLLIPVFLLTNASFILSERTLHPSYIFAKPDIRSYISDYAMSLNREYRGPIEGIVDFFKKRGITKATVYTDYEVDSIKFYFPEFHFVDRTIVSGHEYPTPHMAGNFLEITDFYIPREFWGGLIIVGKCERDILFKNYHKFELPYYDIPWNNLPDITYHKFRLDAELPKLVIYEKRAGVDFDICKKLPPVP